MKCRLEKLNLKFAEDLARAIGNRRVNDNLRDLPNPYTADNAREFINYALSADENNEFIYAITVNGSFAGCISATRQQNIHNRTAEIGYYIVPGLWGNGLATSALTQLCDMIFENTDIIRLYAEPFLRNAASCRVLEKAGFTCEGVLRRNAVKNGVIEDMKMYSKIK